jgi:aspartyl-tRNA(Asn)/glutamyl-tRNA(Gln) amidotransferase subunit A
MEAWKQTHAIEVETLVKARDQSGSSEKRQSGARVLHELGGVPLVVKGNYMVTGAPISAHATGLLKGYEPEEDATLVKRLQSVGMVIAGKTRFDEFGLGAADMLADHSVLNPWYSKTDRPKEARSAGGAAGGPAVAVATGMAFGAISSDACGTIRLPAAWCGVVGLRPTPGRLPRTGLLTPFKHWEVPGILTRTVTDAALLLSMLQGPDGRDQDVAEPCERLSKLPEDALQQPAEGQYPLEQTLGLEGDQPLKGIRIGIPAGDFEQEAHLSPVAKSSWQRSLEWLQQSGAELKEVELTEAEPAVAALYSLAAAEAEDLPSQLVQAMKASGQGQDPAARVRDAIAKATANNRSYANAHPCSVQDAQRAQQSVKDTLSGLIKNNVDIIATPAAPSVAPTVGDAADASEEFLFGIDSLNVQATLAGLPAISVPVGLSAKEGLPLGVQLMGAPFGEARLLAVAHLLELAAKANREEDAEMMPLTQD